MEFGMRSNSIRTSRLLVAGVLVALSLIGGCARHDASGAIVARTRRALQGIADSGGCLAPAFRQAIQVLEESGPTARAVMLGAAFGDATEVGHGWIYEFMWVDVRGEVRGFYVRADADSDVDVYPVILNEQQVEDTAWLVQAGPVITELEQRSNLDQKLRQRAIVLPRRLLLSKKLLVGLILSDGGKTEPVHAELRRRTPGGWVDALAGTDTLLPLGNGDPARKIEQNK